MLQDLSKTSSRLLQDHFNTSPSTQPQLNSNKLNSTQTTELDTTQLQLVYDFLQENIKITKKCSQNIIMKNATP